MRLIKKSNSFDKCFFAVAFTMRSYLLVILLVTMFCKVTSDCDNSNPKVEEGNLGQSPVFPWLGILRVYLPGEFGDKPDIALTGLVLIKKTHALVSADDVVKIPEKIFNEHTHAMFLPYTESPWFCRPKSFKAHEEYDQIINTIALLELDLEDEAPIPVRPICWSRRMPHHTSLYLTGYTDETGILEKVIHRVQYKEKRFCDEFYETTELTEAKRTPAHYICGFTRMKYQCLWENGMVLVSNASHQFSLIGFSIRGPGCSAPARFIDLHKYQKWVEDATTEDYRRKTDSDELDMVSEFKRIHFSQALDTEVPKPLGMKYISYGFNPEKPGYFNVDKEDNHTLVVRPFNDSIEAYTDACKGWKSLLYSEYMELKSMLGAHGVAYYKISLYDLLKKACGCVRIHIDSMWRDEAIISYKEFFDINEGTALTSSEETPSHILKHFPPLERTTSSTPSSKWQPSHNLKVEFLKDQRQRSRLLHYDLYVRFGFHYRAIVKIEMFAEAMPPTTTPKPKGRRRMFDLPVLTSKEERMEYQKLKRYKLTRPPARKMWYDDIPKNRSSRSGFVQSVPDVVINYFDSDNLNDSIYNVDFNKIDDLNDVMEPETEETYLKFIRSSISPDEMEMTETEQPEAATSYRDTIQDLPKLSSILPEFILNAVQSMSSAPKMSMPLQNITKNSSLKSGNVFQLCSDKFICLSILALYILLH